MKFCLCFLLISLTAQLAYAIIYTARNTPRGELPLPLKILFTNANIIQVGAGSGGALTATLLPQSNCIKILVLDDGYTVNLNDSSIGIVPGTEDAAGYYHPGLETSSLIVPNPHVNGDEQLSYGAIWRDIKGGNMRLSHYAIESGSSDIHRKLFYEPFGMPPEWAPEYVWGHIIDNVMNFSGPDLTPNHLDLGHIRAQESRDCPWEDYWLQACANITGTSINLDFNTLNGSIHTCGAELSNVQTDGLRSITENEYLIPEATANPNLILIRDTKVSKILFDKTANECGPSQQ